MVNMKQWQCVNGEHDNVYGESGVWYGEHDNMYGEHETLSSPISSLHHQLQIKNKGKGGGGRHELDRNYRPKKLTVVQLRTVCRWLVSHKYYSFLLLISFFYYWPGIYLFARQLLQQLLNIYIMFLTCPSFT